jgi:ATP-binding protein involved in chromosome partitioning
VTDPRTSARAVAPTEDEQRLRIEWADGHVSEYQPRALRLACPCAGCVEEMTGRPLLDPSTIAPDIWPRSIRYVGRYALRFDFSDQHDTGIYTFELLRALCPCAECRTRAPAAG